MDTKKSGFQGKSSSFKASFFMSMFVFGSVLYTPTFRSYDCISNNWIRGPPIVGFRHQSCSDGFKVHMWNFACLGAWPPMGAQVKRSKTHKFKTNIQEITNRTHGPRTPKKPEYLIARTLATSLLRGPLGFDPIQSLMDFCVIPWN